MVFKELFNIMVIILNHYFKIVTIILNLAILILFYQRIYFN